MGIFYNPRIVTDGLVLALDAGNTKSYPGSGTAWTDLSGNNNTGTLTNGPTYSSANGGSLVFDGTEDYYASISGSIIVSAVTFSVWLKRNGTQVDFTGILNSRGTDSSGMVFAYNYGTLGYNWNDSEYYFDSQLTPPDGAWCMCVVTVTSTEAKFYLGQSSGITTATNTTTHASTTLDALKLAVDDVGLSRNFNGSIAQASLYNRALSAAEVSQNFNALKSRFIQDGSSADRAAPSASYLVSLGNTADGVYWIDLPTAGPTQVYCILNPAYDGGGWMMAMKATTGTTFNYSANYWTTANTLNPTETNRNNGDAKFDTMNYFSSKDMMAVWPDISNGGSIPSSTLGWTWLQNDFYDGTKITPVDFFNISYPTMDFGGSGKFIQDAKTYSGWASGIFSSQPDIRFYGFNYINNPQYGAQAKMRWGFGWNENGEGLYPSSFVSAYGSNDVSGGIGMDSGFGSYSAGDRINCCQDTIGINRSARVEVYVR